MKPSDGHEFIVIDAKILSMTSGLMFGLMRVILVSGIMIQAGGQSGSIPEVPEKIKAPAGEQVVLKAHATGAQIYVCQLAADGKPAWVLKGPEAELRDDQGQMIGRHYAGPAWKHNDGSEVIGKAVGRVDAPDSDSIAWLLLSATGHSGSGMFGRVTTIQRIHTKGGQPPAATECSAAKQNTEVKSNYTADYYFYAPAK